MPNVAVDSRNAGNSTPGATTLSWSHTVSAGLPNSHLAVLIATGSGTPVTPSSVVWDSGGANTNLSNTINGVTALQNDTLNQAQASIWVLSNPASGTKTILITVGTSCDIAGGSESQKNVNQTSPYNSASPQKWQVAANTNISQSVTSATGELVVDSEAIDLSSGSPVATPGAGQTQISNNVTQAGGLEGLSSDQPGAATVTVAWTGLTSGVGASAGLAMSLKAAPDAVSPKFTRPFPYKPAGARSAGLGRF